MTAQLYYHSARAYFGFRCYLNDSNDERIHTIIEEGLRGMNSTIEAIETYPHPGPVGEYDWKKDASRAQLYHDRITNGWADYNFQYFKRKADK